MFKNSLITQGYTLIELVATIAITGTLLALAVPSFNAAITSSRITSYANDFVSALNLARSEAVRRGISVTMHKVDSYSSCTKNNVVANWENGWDVFTDMDNDGKCDVGDELIRSYPSLANDYTLINNGLYNKTVTYFSNGLSSVAGTTSSEDVFRLCNGTDISTSRAISIELVGRVHVSPPGSAPVCI